MKKSALVLFIAVLSLVFVLGGLCGCKDSKTNVYYYEYGFDSLTNDFLPTGIRLKLLEDYRGFEMSYPAGVTVYGEVEQNFSGYSLNCNPDIMLALSGLSDLENTDSQESQAQLDQLGDSILVTQQIFFCGDYIFDSSSVELIKAVSQDQNANPASPEGLYDFTEDDTIQYRLAGGLVYSITIDDKGVATESTQAVGRYVAQDGFLTIFRINADGSDLYLEGKKQYITYMFGSISYPDNFADFVYTDDAYSESVKESSQYLSGKTIAVLCSKFYKRIK